MTVTAAAWFFDCECGQGIPSPNGSLMWTPDQTNTGNPVVICTSCGKKHRIPKRCK